MDLNAVEVKISVGGSPCDFIWMNLDQYVSTHHTFEIAVDYYHKDKSVWAITPDDIFRETLGKPVGIQMTHKESGVTNEFSGIVTDIEAVGVNGDQGTIIIRGGSPTILLDRNPAMHSFVDYTLYNVVAETIGDTAVPVSMNNSPKMSRTIPYIARYDESSYAFLSRILAAYGEWFYYDGKKLIVGNPLNQDECRVTFDVELQEVRSAAGMRNLNTRYYDYNSEDKNYFEERSDTIRNANLPMRGAKMASDPMFPKPAKRPVGREVLGETDISNIIRTKQSREYTKCSVFTAKCNTCGIHIGGVATIHLPKAKDVFFIDLGSFRVLEVHHSVNREGYYTNTFKGITALTETLPDDHIVMPRAFAEPAIVIDNTDPKNKGRVKVRFAWQPESLSTNWIQVQTPDAGSSGAVPKNRGFFFIPEIDDQVIIGFQYGDPSRPYVMGSLYHRKITRGAAKDNTIKSISTKSGHIIEFNDDEAGAWGITIKDKEGNVIHLDTKGKVINITAPEKINISSKEVNISGSDSVNISSDKLISSDSKKEIKIHASESVGINGESSVSIESLSIDVTGSKSVAIEGAVTVDIKGATVNSEGTVMNNVKGAILNLN